MKTMQQATISSIVTFDEDTSTNFQTIQSTTPKVCFPSTRMKHSCGSLVDSFMRITSNGYLHFSATLTNAMKPRASNLFFVLNASRESANKRIPNHSTYKIFRLPCLLAEPHGSTISTNHFRICCSGWRQSAVVMNPGRAWQKPMGARHSQCTLVTSRPYS